MAELEEHHKHHSVAVVEEHHTVVGVVVEEHHKHHGHIVAELEEDLAGRHHMVVVAGKELEVTAVVADFADKVLEATVVVVVVRLEFSSSCSLDQIHLPHQRLPPRLLH